MSTFVARVSIEILAMPSVSDIFIEIMFKNKKYQFHHHSIEHENQNAQRLLIFEN